MRTFDLQKMDLQPQKEIVRWLNIERGLPVNKMDSNGTEVVAILWAPGTKARQAEGSLLFDSFPC